jgi:hypothetical protein
MAINFNILLFTGILTTGLLACREAEYPPVAEVEKSIARYYTQLQQGDAAGVAEFCDPCKTLEALKHETCKRTAEELIAQQPVIRGPCRINIVQRSVSLGRVVWATCPVQRRDGRYRDTLQMVSIDSMHASRCSEFLWIIKHGTKRIENEHSN